MSVLDTILDYLPGSKIGRQIIAETAESKLAKRRELVDEIAQSEARLAAELPALDAAIKPAEKEEAKTAAAAAKAHHEATAARFARSRLPTSIEGQVSGLHKKLRDSAPAAIGELNRQLLKMHGETIACKPEPSEETTDEYVDYGSRRSPVVIVKSKSEALASRAAAILRGVEENQKLGLQALTDEEVAAAQAKILASIPSGDTMSRVYPPTPPRFSINQNAGAFASG